MKRPPITRYGYAAAIGAVLVVALALVTQSRAAYLLLALVIASFLVQRARPRRPPTRPDWHRDRARRAEEEAAEARQDSERRLHRF